MNYDVNILKFRHFSPLESHTAIEGAKRTSVAVRSIRLVVDESFDNLKQNSFGLLSKPNIKLSMLFFIFILIKSINISINI